LSSSVKSKIFESTNAIKILFSIWIHCHQERWNCINQCL